MLQITVHLRGQRAIDFNFPGNPVVLIKRGYLSEFGEYKISFIWNEEQQRNIILADCYTINPYMPTAAYWLNDVYRSINK